MSQERSPAICPACGEKAKSNGYCARHNSQWDRRGRPQGEWTASDGTKVLHVIWLKQKVCCRVPRCKRKHSGEGYCKTHFTYWDSHGRPDRWLSIEGYLIFHGQPWWEQDPWPRPFLVQKRLCRVPTCKSKIVQNGYCNRHQYQWRREDRPATWVTQEGIQIIHALSRYEQDRTQTLQIVVRKTGRICTDCGCSVKTDHAKCYRCREKAVPRYCTKCSKRLSSKTHKECRDCREAARKKAKRYCECGRWLRGDHDQCHVCREKERPPRVVKPKKPCKPKVKARAVVQPQRAKPAPPSTVRICKAPSDGSCRNHPHREAHANGYCYHCLVFLKNA